MRLRAACFSAKLNRHPIRILSSFKEDSTQRRSTMTRGLANSFGMIVVLTALAALPVDAPAAESFQPRYNAVEFQAEAQREVQNDLLNATLYVELNDANAAALANAINT